MSRYIKDQDGPNHNPVCASLTATDAISAATLAATTSISVGAVTLTEAELTTLDALGGFTVVGKEVTFTETAGAGVYTGSVVVPAGAWLVDIIIHGVAVWDNDGAVDMDVGVSGAATSYFDITSLKAGGDLVAGESISFGTGSDGGEGGTIAATNFARYSATARTIDGIITTASTGGSTGRTRMVVLWVLPLAAHTSAAVKA